MPTIQEVVLQIKDKNVIWEDKTEEVYFKKKKTCFSTLLIRIFLMLVLIVAV